MVLGAAGWMDQFERECSGQESLRPNVSSEGRVTTNFGGVQGARGEGDDQLWGSGRGAI